MKFDDNQIEHYQWHGGKIMLSSRFVLPALFLFFLACTTQIHMKSIIMHTINLLGIHLYALSHIARCAIYAKNIEAATNFGKKIFLIPGKSELPLMPQQKKSAE